MWIVDVVSQQFLFFVVLQGGWGWDLQSEVVLR